MLKLEKGESFTFGLAVLVIVLSVTSVVSGVYSNFGAIFYVLFALTVVIGFYMSYNISKERPAPKQKRKA